MIGSRFGCYVVAGTAAPSARGHKYWMCLCDCGAEKAVRHDALVRGQSRSCGCQSQSSVKNGATDSAGKMTPTYRVWASMRERCLNPKQRAFVHYGGRGIGVCERWNDYRNFLADMGEKKPGMSIERIDVNGNYEPGNCKWIPVRQQGWNTRKTVLSPEIAERIRRLRNEGVRPCDIARALSVKYPTVQSVIHGRQWKAAA